MIQRLLQEIQELQLEGCCRYRSVEVLLFFGALKEAIDHGFSTQQRAHDAHG